ncbi:MAG: hypothetical protein MUF23_10945 [Pirellula sp.]|nr:hypothetical protein [Pirellula sp.]
MPRNTVRRLSPIGGIFTRYYDASCTTKPFAVKHLRYWLQDILRKIRMFQGNKKSVEQAIERVVIQN